MPSLLRAITWVLLVALLVSATGVVTVCVEADGSARYELAAVCCGSPSGEGDAGSDEDAASRGSDCLGCDDESLAAVERAGPAPSPSIAAPSLTLAPLGVASLEPRALRASGTADGPPDPLALRPAALRS